MDNLQPAEKFGSDGLCADFCKARYDEQLLPCYAAARLWVDAMIDPLETRRVVSEGVAAANHAPIERAYNVGVIQV